ncbi:MAG: glycine zipper family protein [Gammaproteobacteria bacterium]
MNISVKTGLTAALIVALAGCAAVPTGPSVMVLPGPAKDFDQFRADDFQCRQYALAQIGAASPSQASATGAGTEAVKASGYEAQERYDMSFIQCMFASGNRVPVSGNFIDDTMLGGDELPFLMPPPPPPQSMLPPPNP